MVRRCEGAGERRGRLPNNLLIDDQMGVYGLRLARLGLLGLLLLFAAGCRFFPSSGAEPERAAAPNQTPTVIAAAEATAAPTAEPAATATALPASPTPPPTSTDVPTAVPTDTPSPTLPPTATATPPPTETPPPTVTPLPTETPTPEPPPLPAWLTYLNQFRSIAGLPPVLDWEPYTIGSERHSYYMVARDAAIAHSEDRNDPLYSAEGDQAARNGNIFATSQSDANYVWSLNFWASAPFHLIGMLDPNLNLVGYGDDVDNGGDVVMAAVLDIGSDKGTDSGVTYPIMFPGPESSTWIVRHSMYEWPDPVASCPGYSRPTGAPIVVFLGDGRGKPSVSNHRLAMGDTPLESCLFDETNYSNPDPYAEKVGRTILGLNDAVVIIPRYPLAVDETYTVQLNANGASNTWRFHTIRRPSDTVN
ncbi:MAG: CAP domain-containing protein [Candidatus Promineifilaceae bacterium]